MLPFLLVAGALLLVIFLIGFYNSVVKLRIRVEEAWADIDTFLKQRYDMIPNLVSTVRGYMKHEEKTLTRVTELRSMVANATTMQERAEADNQLSQTLKTLFAVAENYPDLKANENFLELQRELKNLEDSLQKARRFYNATVRDYMTKIQMFPGNLIAGILNFEKKEFFEVEGEERENVKVSFEDAPVADTSSSEVSSQAVAPQGVSPTDVNNAASPTTDTTSSTKDEN